MNTTQVKQLEVYERDNIEGFNEFAAKIDKWSVGLWWGDFEEAGIDRCYIVFDGDEPIGFQTVSKDGFCIAIEVKSNYQGYGVALMLVEESGCYRPDCRNENPEFWSKMQCKFGN